MLPIKRPRTHRELASWCGSIRPGRYVKLPRQLSQRVTCPTAALKKFQRRAESVFVHVALVDTSRRIVTEDFQRDSDNQLSASCLPHHAPFLLVRRITSTRSQTFEHTPSRVVIAPTPGAWKNNGEVSPTCRILHDELGANNRAMSPECRQSACLTWRTYAFFTLDAATAGSLLAKPRTGHCDVTTQGGNVLPIRDDDRTRCRESFRQMVILPGAWETKPLLYCWI